MGKNYYNDISLSEAGSEEEWEHVSNADYCEDDDEQVLLDDEGKFKYVVNETKMQIHWTKMHILII